ncbi:unnamed protein product [Boreogadus saida]
MRTGDWAVFYLIIKPRNAGTERSPQQSKNCNQSNVTLRSPLSNRRHADGRGRNTAQSPRRALLRRRFDQLGQGCLETVHTASEPSGAAGPVLASKEFRAVGL